MANQAYKRRTITHEEVLRLEEMAKSTWQADLKDMVSGKIDGFHVEPGDQERLTDEELQKKTHYLFNAIQYKLTKGAKEADCDYRDFVKALRSGRRVTVYRRLDSEGNLIPIPEKFRQYVATSETRPGVTLRRTGASLGESFSQQADAQEAPRRKTG